MATFTNKTKNSSTLTNKSFNSSTLTNKAKSGTPLDAFVLLLDNTYKLLIDSTYFLEIQTKATGNTVTNKTKN